MNGDDSDGDNGNVQCGDVDHSGGAEVEDEDSGSDDGPPSLLVVDSDDEVLFDDDGEQEADACSSPSGPGTSLPPPLTGSSSSL
eukprot:11171582-Lingulodinium_polyedra.AAC.1